MRLDEAAWDARWRAGFIATQQEHGRDAGQAEAIPANRKALKTTKIEPTRQSFTITCVVYIYQLIATMIGVIVAADPIKSNTWALLDQCLAIFRERGLLCKTMGKAFLLPFSSIN